MGFEPSFTDLSTKVQMKCDSKVEIQLRPLVEPTSFDDALHSRKFVTSKTFCVVLLAPRHWQTPQLASKDGGKPSSSPNSKKDLSRQD